jgi:hypothetical protein
MADHLGIAVKPGDPVKAEDIMKLVAAVNALLSPRGGDGIDVRQVGGRIHMSAIPTVDKYLCKATSDFAAISGTTPGTGSADLYWYDGTDLAATGESMSNLVSASITTMTSGNSIDSGMWCFVFQDAFGTWYIAPNDCS